MAKFQTGKRGIGDKGYRGEKGVMSTPNAHDAKPLRKFKGRVRSRHESFNGAVLYQSFILYIISDTCQRTEKHVHCDSFQSHRNDSFKLRNLRNRLATTVLEQ